MDRLPLNSDFLITLYSSFLIPHYLSRPRQKHRRRKSDQPCGEHLVQTYRNMPRLHSRNLQNRHKDAIFGRRHFPQGSPRHRKRVHTYKKLKNREQWVVSSERLLYLNIAICSLYRWLDKADPDGWIRLIQMVGPALFRGANQRANNKARYNNFN